MISGLIMGVLTGFFLQIFIVINIDYKPLLITAVSTGLYIILLATTHLLICSNVLSITIIGCMVGSLGCYGLDAGIV